MKRPLFIIKWMKPRVKCGVWGKAGEFNGTAFALASFAMARLQGNKPNVATILIGTAIFALIAAGLFFAFRPVPEPTDAATSNSTIENSATGETSTNESGGASSDTNSTSNATSDNSDNSASDNSQNSATTILTPLPLATPALTGAPATAATPQTNATSTGAATPATPTDNSALAPLSNSVAAPTPSATNSTETTPLNSATPR